jgi:hypothetical protein
MDQHEIEHAIDMGPPPQLIQLFTHAPENYEQRHATASRSFRMSRDIVRQILPVIDQAMDAAKAIYSEARDLYNRWSGVKEVLMGQLAIVEAAEFALTAEETPMAEEEANAIPEQMDVDHAF